MMEISSIDNQKKGLIEKNDCEIQKENNKLIILIGSTYFYIYYNNKPMVEPVLLLFYKDEQIIYGKKVYRKLNDPDYLDKTMILYDFLYFINKEINAETKLILKKRRLFKSLFFYKQEDNPRYLDNNSIIKFNFKLRKSNEKHRKFMESKKILESIKVNNHLTVDNNYYINYSPTSKELLEIFIKLLYEDLPNIFNDIKFEKININIIFPSYLNDVQKNIIKDIFIEIFKNKFEKSLKLIFEDEINYYLYKISKKIQIENKIIFIHFGGSSLVVILYDYNSKIILCKKEKLIGGLDIDVILTNKSLTKFEIDNNGAEIMDVIKIYRIKNEIEEQKKELGVDGDLNIEIESIKYNRDLNYEMKNNYLKEIFNEIKVDFKNLLDEVIEVVENKKEEIKKVIYTGNNFKLHYFVNFLHDYFFDYFGENRCESIFDEEE